MFGRPPPRSPLVLLSSGSGQAPSVQERNLTPTLHRYERDGAPPHHELSAHLPGTRTNGHPYQRAQPPPPSSSSLSLNPNDQHRPQPSSSYRPPAPAGPTGHAPSSYQPSGRYSCGSQPPPPPPPLLPLFHHQHSPSTSTHPSHLAPTHHYQHPPSYLPTPLPSSSATTSVDAHPYHGGYAVGDFHPPPLPPPPQPHPNLPSPPFPNHLRTSSHPSSNPSDREMAYATSRPPSVELGAREGQGGGGRPGLFVERRDYPAGGDEGGPVGVGEEDRRGEPRSQHEYDMMVQNRHQHELQEEDERYGRSGPPSPYYYPPSSSSSYSGTYPHHQPQPPPPQHSLHPYQQPPSASTSASSSPYPSHHQSYAQPPPSSWSSQQSPYGPPPHHSSSLPTPHPGHPHLLGRQPMQHHSYGLPSPLHDPQHPPTISPTQFSRPLLAQQSHSNSTTSSHVDTHSPYASYHSHSGGSSIYEDHDADELAPYSSPNQWQTSPPLDQQGGAVGWANSAGGGLVGGAARQPYVQGGGRMGYVGEGSVGGDGVGGEPMRRAPGQIVKMGGKPKKGGAKGAAGTGGVDGRGKGEDNWIGGQKTRRQVKNACTTCQKLHKPCDEQRPCARCTKRGPKFAEECRDSDRKPKKGMPRSRAARAARTSAPSAAGGGGEVAKPVLTMTAAAGFVERGGGSGGGLALESNASSSTAMSRRAGLRGGGGLVHSPDDETSKSRKPSEDSSYASSIRHSRSSTSSSSSSGFPMLHLPYGIRRQSSLAYQHDPVDVGGVMVVDREHDGLDEHEEMGIRGWHAEEKDNMERRDHHQQNFAYPVYRPRSPFPLQAPLGHHHPLLDQGRTYHPQHPPPPQPQLQPRPSSHLPPPQQYYQPQYPPPPPVHHPHHPPPDHQPSFFNPPQSFNLERPPPPAPRTVRLGPPSSLIHLPFRTQRVENGMIDPPPSPRGDLPTPEVYKRSPKAKSPLGAEVVESEREQKKDEDETSLSPPPSSLGADAVAGDGEGSPAAETEVDVVEAASTAVEEEESKGEEGEKMVGVVVEEEGGP